MTSTRRPPSPLQAASQAIGPSPPGWTLNGFGDDIRRKKRSPTSSRGLFQNSTRTDRRESADLERHSSVSTDPTLLMERSENTSELSRKASTTSARHSSLLRPNTSPGWPASPTSLPLVPSLPTCGLKQEDRHSSRRSVAISIESSGTTLDDRRRDSLVEDGDAGNLWQIESKTSVGTVAEDRHWLYYFLDQSSRSHRGYRLYAGLLPKHGPITIGICPTAGDGVLAVAFTPWGFHPKIIHLDDILQQSSGHSSHLPTTSPTSFRSAEDLGVLLPHALARTLEGSDGFVFGPSTSPFSLRACEPKFRSRKVAEPHTSDGTSGVLSHPRPPMDMVEIRQSGPALDMLNDLDIRPSTSVLCYDVILDLDSSPIDAIAPDSSNLDLSRHNEVQQVMAAFGVPLHTRARGSSTTPIQNEARPLRKRWSASSTGTSESEKSYRNAINELYHTEHSYVQKLETLVDLYQEFKGTLNPYESTGDLGWHEVQRVFGGVDDLYRANTDFLKELQAALDHMNEEPDAVGRCVSKHASSFEIYKRYISTYSNRSEMYKRLYERSDVFYNTVSQYLNENNIPISMLETMLIEPVQRIGRYTLLLKEIAKFATGAAASSIESAERAMRSLAKKVNAAPVFLESGEQLFQLQKAIEECPTSVISGQRQLITAIPMTLYPSNGEHAKKSITVFLLSDLVLLAEGKIGKDVAATEARLVAIDITKKRGLKFWSMCRLSDVRLVDFHQGSRRGFDLVLSSGQSAPGISTPRSGTADFAAPYLGPSRTTGSGPGSRRGATLEDVPEDSEPRGNGLPGEVLRFGSALPEATLNSFVTQFWDEQAKQMAREEQKIQLFTRTFEDQLRVYFFIREKAEARPVCRHGGAILITDEGASLYLDPSVPPYVGITVRLQSLETTGERVYSISRVEPMLSEDVRRQDETVSRGTLADDLTKAIHETSRSVMGSFVEEARFARRLVLLEEGVRNMGAHQFLHQTSPRGADTPLSRSSSSNTLRLVYRRATARILRARRSECMSTNLFGRPLLNGHATLQGRRPSSVNGDSASAISDYRGAPFAEGKSRGSAQTAQYTQTLHYDVFGASKRSRRASLDILLGGSLSKAAQGWAQRTRNMTISEWASSINKSEKGSEVSACRHKYSRTDAERMSLEPASHSSSSPISFEERQAPRPPNPPPRWSIPQLGFGSAKLAFPRRGSLSSHAPSPALPRTSDATPVAAAPTGSGKKRRSLFGVSFPSSSSALSRRQPPAQTQSFPQATPLEPPCKSNTLDDRPIKLTDCIDQIQEELAIANHQVQLMQDLHAERKDREAAVSFGEIRGGDSAFLVSHPDDEEGVDDENPEANTAVFHDTCVDDDEEVAPLSRLSRSLSRLADYLEELDYEIRQVPIPPPPPLPLSPPPSTCSSSSAHTVQQHQKLLDENAKLRATLRHVVKDQRSRASSMLEVLEEVADV